MAAKLTDSVDMAAKLTDRVDVAAKLTDGVDVGAQDKETGGVVLQEVGSGVVRDLKRGHKPVGLLRKDGRVDYFRKGESVETLVS
eukprot:2115852-Rhodomonas_salina.2